MIDKVLIYNKAQRLAQRVLKESGQDDLSNYPLEQLILSRGCFYEESKLSGKQGEIISSGSNSIITVNSSIEFLTTKRWVQSHELGHFEMHRDLVPIISDSSEDMVNWYKAGPQETEANQFAADLLMPARLFSQECELFYFDPELIAHLADKFQVSKTAATLRFVEYGNHPVCIIFSKNNQMKWWKSSDDWKYFIEFERDKETPINSVANEIFTEKTTYNRGNQQQEIRKSTWLRHDTKYGDPIFFEYCLFSQSYNYCLSIIWEA